MSIISVADQSLARAHLATETVEVISLIFSFALCRTVSRYLTTNLSAYLNLTLSVSFSFFLSLTTCFYLSAQIARLNKAQTKHVQTKQLMLRGAEGQDVVLCVSCS